MNMTETEKESEITLDAPPSKTKRPKLSQTLEAEVLLQSIQARLPYIVSLPNNWNQNMETKLFQKYFDVSIRPNVFVLTSIIKLAGNNPYAAIDCLKEAGAFSNANSRKVLLELIEDARKADTYRLDCSDDLLDTVEAYAKYAFSIEEDGQTVGCGSVHKS